MLNHLVHVVALGGQWQPVDLQPLHVGKRLSCLVPRSIVPAQPHAVGIHFRELLDEALPLGPAWLQHPFLYLLLGNALGLPPTDSLQGIEKRRAGRPRTSIRLEVREAPQDGGSLAGGHPSAAGSPLCSRLPWATTAACHQ